MTAVTVAYVTTHYPRVALSFISGEIDEMEKLGASIHTFAMNGPDAADLLSDDARARSAGTVYLKASGSKLAGDVFAFTLRHPAGTARLVWRAISSARGDVPLMLRRLSHLAQAASLARECERRGIRHIHAHFGLAPATIAWFATGFLNLRCRDTARWSFTIHGFHDFVNETVSRLDLKAQSASFVACVSDFTRSQLCRLLHPSLWPNARIIRCGIDLDQFRPRPQRPPGSPPTIVTVGRLSSEKGQLVLLDACKLLAGRGLPFRAVLIGSGPLEQLLRDEIAKAGLQDRVQLRGELPAADVREELERADIFCLTSFAEGLPVSIMEAMAVGVPVVATWIAGIPELAVNGETALTVAPGNAERLADAIATVLNDEELRTRLVAAARARVEEAHDRRRNARQLYELFAAEAQR